MKVVPIKTRKVLPPKDDLSDVLKIVLPKIKENMVVVITSKIVSICEGSCIPISKIADKDKLIISESDKYLERKYVKGGFALHTLKNNILIPTAGIDESNGNNYYILWPKNPKQSAVKILKYLKQNTGIKNLGVIISDSHSIPLRRGVIGFSLSSAGFNPLKDYRNQKDIFNHSLVMTQSNIPDSLASAAVLEMGEADEQTPIALISSLPKIVKFENRTTLSKKPWSSFEVSLDEDLFAPFIKSVPWKKGGQ